ncbi:hypothetical protein ONS95_014535 [Cadophora gregata]|uniref:uncharacterized protein n=1 Tax=Cadophora gregata TaxID=51156 RepID=UPI0026DAF957|nr:uncharacterized protein ONS95_014535 [Cadophora gregata]KAK0112805.1 hypothetical protein ONS95_014535 [Cadophora gregata]
MPQHACDIIYTALSPISDITKGLEVSAWRKRWYSRRMHGQREEIPLDGPIFLSVTSSGVSFTAYQAVHDGIINGSQWNAHRQYSVDSVHVDLYHVIHPYLATETSPPSEH